MIDTQFWKIIDSTGHGLDANRDAQVKRITELLMECDLNDLAAFNKQFDHHLSEALTFHFMVATYAIFGCLTDPLFLEFRAWMILQGKGAFKAAAKDPDTIVDLLSRNDVDEISCRGIVGLVATVWLRRGADIELYAKKAKMAVDERPIKTAWPKNRKAFEEKYPLLYKAFWDQERINKHHRQELHELPGGRKLRSSKKLGIISRAQFWKIIDSTANRVGPNRGPQVEKIQEILEQYHLDGLASFKRQLDQQLLKANTFHLMVAAFLVYGYISDDFFLDFRAWLILHGSDTFAAAVKNPGTIAKLVSRDDVDEISCAGFPELALKIWSEKSDDLEIFWEKAGLLEEPEIDMPWPESPSDFEEKYPVLYKAFWNPKRIQAFHRRAQA